jgi:hypothetical protein
MTNEPIVKTFGVDLTPLQILKELLRGSLKASDDPLRQARLVIIRISLGLSEAIHGVFMLQPKNLPGLFLLKKKRVR